MGAWIQQCELYLHLLSRSIADRVGILQTSPMFSSFEERGQNQHLMAPQPDYHGIALASNNASAPYGGFPSYQQQQQSTVIASTSTAIVPSGTIGGFPSICTAQHGTIDTSVLEKVETNTETAEYIWSQADQSLYEVGNPRAINAIGTPGSIRMIFPPHTFICAWEKDGTLASPAFRPLHPHSNQWLKAQVCDSRCAYRAGTSTLKRPVSTPVCICKRFYTERSDLAKITVREHFRKVSLLPFTRG